MRANETPLIIETRSRIKAHTRSVLEMAGKTWNSQEMNIPDMVKYKRYLLREKWNKPNRHNYIQCARYKY